MAKRELLWCLAHAPAHEATFVLHSGSMAAAFGFCCSTSTLGEDGLIGSQNKLDSALNLDAVSG